MRGALTPIDGVAAVDVKVGQKAMTVTIDTRKTTPDALIAALKKAGEEAKVVP